MSDKNVITNYKYIKTIGEGTFGKVKLATHILTGEKVTIKILEKNLIKGKNEYQRIEREIKYLKLFNHPNIIQIYEVIESSSSFFIVMEYAPGGELFNYIVEKEKLTEEESSFYLYQIIQGVKEIHKKKICHRDIKPENLLFTKNKILKIIDFGLSSEYENYLTTPCGSPCYASPEMIKGKKYNGLSIDLWACGIILFAMLCGYLPFDDKNNDGLFKKILEGKIDYPDPVEDDIDLSDNALDLINKILTANPKKRIGIEDILKHPFMDYGKKEYYNVIKPDNFEQEELIVNYMVNELGFENENNIIMKYIHINKHNHITTTYKLLKQKYIEGRLNYTFRKKITKQISKQDCFRNSLNAHMSNINVNKNNLSFNNNSNYNLSKKNIKKIKNKFPLDDKEQKLLNDITNNQRSKTTSRSQSKNNSKKDILSLKDMIKNKDLENRNNIIIINNTNMIQEPEKLKSIYKDLFFKNESAQKQFFRKIETSVSLEKSVNKNNYLNSNNIDSKLNNTFNTKNIKEQIKVSLKKDEKKDNPFGYFKKININDLKKKKFIYFPSNNFSNKKNDDAKFQKRNIPNEIIINKKNSTGMSGFNNIYSFDGNLSNNYNSSISHNLNALSNDNINLNFNSTRNEDEHPCSSSLGKNINYNKYSNYSIKHIFINNNKFKNRYLYKNSEHNIINTLDINKENEILRKKIEKGKINYVKNIEKICKRIIKKNNKIYMNNNRKTTSYDINKNNQEKKSKESRNKNNNNNVNNNANVNQQNKNGIISININNNSKKDNFKPATSRIHKSNKNIYNFLSTNNTNSNKILIKNILTKNINSNFNPKKLSQIQIGLTLENNFNKFKNSLINKSNISNNYYKKIAFESFNERSKKLTNKIPTIKNLSPVNNRKNSNNINTFKKINKKNKINRNIKEILSLKGNLIKNKSKLKNKTNIYNIMQREKDKEREKDSFLIESTSRNNITNSNYSFIAITTRDKKDSKHVYVSRNQNNDYINNNNMIKSNTVLLEQKPSLQNKILSSEKKSAKGKNVKEWSSQSKEGGKYMMINNNESKQIIINKKHNNNVDKFLVTNTEMTLYQISEKLNKFCKENNLICKKDGIYNFIISTQNNKSTFSVEITHSSPLNIVKFFHGKNTESKMKEIITRLFIEIVNY